MKHSTIHHRTTVMTFTQIAEGILNGSITIDENSHDPFYGWGDKLLKGELTQKLKWIEKGSFAYLVSRDFQPNEPIYDLYDTRDCSQCGERVSWALSPDLKAVKCIHVFYGKNYKENVVMHEPCVFKVMPAFRQKFEVKGPVVFVNFLRDLATPSDDRSNQEFSLNHSAGIRNLTAYLTEQNCVYCQTGNMSVHFFINKKMDRIIVVDRDEDDDIDVMDSLKGWAKLGSISCDMWRWMLVNASDIKDRETSVSSEQFDAEIPLGTWDVVHYFGTSEEGTVKVGGLEVMSEMKLRH